MKYVYYILAIIVVLSGLSIYGMLDTRIEISKPVLSINDRIYSETELERLLEVNLADMTREEFIDALIDEQLLIQKAIELEINNEEDFRRSVENYYEQSLIKILMDRKMGSIVVSVSDEEINRYKSLSQSKLTITKLIYPDMNNLQNRVNEKIEIVESDFINLSDNLKFIIMNLNEGDTSSPLIRNGIGIVLYRLDRIQQREAKTDHFERPFDLKRVSLFIKDKKKEQILETWIEEIRNSADIWRKK